MNFRKTIFSAATALAICACFAFKPAQETVIYGTYIDPISPSECITAAPILENDCSTAHTGRQCHCWDPDYGMQPAYLDNGYPNQCVTPYRQQF